MTVSYLGPPPLGDDEEDCDDEDDDEVVVEPLLELLWVEPPGGGDPACVTAPTVEVAPGVVELPDEPVVGLSVAPAGV